MNKRIAVLLLVVIFISILPFSAFAMKAEIQLAGKIGFMYEDMSVTLKPRIMNVSANEIVWSSSDENVAIVDGGTIKSLAAGKTIITASGNGAVARCGVVVLPKMIQLKTGESFALPNGTVESYTVQYNAVAGISRNGVITGKKAGTTLIRVRYGKQTLYVQVEVTDMNANALQSEAANLDCAAQTSQIVLVDHKSGSKANLSIHEKRSGIWTELYSCEAFVGKNGIGKTREGDNKTPTGTFNLTIPFGIKADPGANGAYTQVTKYHYWCGTSGSELYNQLVDMRVTDRKCTSSDEYLINYKGEYNYCMFVDYNDAGEAGKGSCIFLHCTGKKDYTAGCIAVPEKVMQKIIQWAKPGVKIVIR